MLQYNADIPLVDLLSPAKSENLLPERVIVMESLVRPLLHIPDRSDQSGTSTICDVHQFQATRILERLAIKCERESTDCAERHRVGHDSVVAFNYLAIESGLLQTRRDRVAMK